VTRANSRRERGGGFFRMRILAIETVDTTGSVAALENERVVVEHPLDPKRRSAQTLAPAIAELLAKIAWRPKDVELVAVATGPGSFTGLRIGVTTAKCFAYAAGCQVIGVHTLLAVASRVLRDVPRFTVVLDAQRGELFVADFSRGEVDKLSGHEATRIVRVQDWLATLVPNMVVTGPGLAKIGARSPDEIRGALPDNALPDNVVMLDPATTAPTAAAVGRLGYQLFAAGQRDSVFDLVPRYFRRTAAEEQWDRKQGG
jgi:tRNA threonylcarbamoyladenosine biosynthesis protein TsaB